MSRRPLPDLSAYLVLDPGLCGGPEGMIATTRAALAGGITVVQLRDKTHGTEALIDTGRTLMRLLEGTKVALIVNDDIDAALAIGAHGLHIGQGDLPVAEARARLGETPLLGLSVETPELAAQVDPALVDYVGCGPVFATPTKNDHKTPVGFDGLARIVAAAPVPAVAIGGLKPEHARDALRAGAQGLAVVSAICGQPDAQAATHTLVTALSEARS